MNFHSDQGWLEVTDFAGDALYAEQVRGNVEVSITSDDREEFVNLSPQDAYRFGLHLMRLALLAADPSRENGALP